MNRKQLLRLARASGFEGKATDPGKLKAELDQWIALENMLFKDLDGKAIDIDAVWKKEVIVTATAGEQVRMEGTASADPDAEYADEKMGDEDEDEDEMPVVPKRANARQIQKALGGGKAPAFHDSDSGTIAKKRYSALASQGKGMFSDADTAEVAGAFFRYQGLRNEDYAQKSSDKAILKAAQVTFDNSLGGALVPDGFINDLIVNKPNFGAAARLTPVTTMSLPKETRPRLVDGVTMTYTNEGEDSDETNAEFDTVDLVSHEISGYVPVSIRLLNNSAVSVADWLSTEFLRASGRKQDGTYFNGDNKQQGILSKIGSGTNSTVSVSGLSSTELLGVTLNDIQELIARAPSWVDMSEAVFTMTRQVYELTLGRFEINAAGNTRDDLRSGSNPGGAFDRVWNGYGVIFNNSTAKAYSNGSIPILFGDFKRSIMYGILSGSQFMRSSEHDQFRKRNVVWIAGEEFAINPHDVNDTAGEDNDPTSSGVVGLKVAN